MMRNICSNGMISVLLLSITPSGLLFNDSDFFYNNCTLSGFFPKI